MKKILALIAFVGLFVSACSERAETNGELRVGTSPDYKPFNYKEDAKLTGVDTDLLNEIAKREGITLNWVEINYDGLIPALKTGKIDMIASAMSATDERRQSVDFSDVYYESTKNLYIKHKDNADLNSREDLEGKALGVQLGSLQEPLANSIKDAKVQASEDLAVAVLALKSKKIDAVIAGKEVLVGFLMENPDLVAFLEEDDGTDSGFSFAVDKGKQAELLNKINKSLKELKEDGTFDKIISKYGLN
ncbi:transporter substrate-binding domain-containing protein [Campylobacter sp.]|uniref:transporter substrate-binding domain-containing protein n=1 Tax=Campylobacter sp. TaxID=205 RepID=UPI0026DB216D|nr:transporter substrate-binding domain-containing protein [Campylobacter sp.]MDO4673789.1 transporter substrate-binding domain-containing protein [Campylobacter sp.]